MSEDTAQLFLKKGAKHVICVKRDQELSDQMACDFAKRFYEQLHTPLQSVCKAFKIAKEECAFKDKKEADKIIIFPNHM